MRIDEVPQDGEYLEGRRRGAYAVGADGRYTVVATAGWQVETAATRVALEAADARIRAAWQAARDGARSALWYHLCARQLTVAQLAHYASAWRLTVWWHLRPGPFARLSPQRLERYARALQVPAARLMRLPEQPESWL